MPFSTVVSSPEGDKTMVFEYYPDTDMLYIRLVDGISTESEEVAPGVVLDFDEHNRVIGVEIEDASKSTRPEVRNP